MGIVSMAILNYNYNTKYESQSSVTQSGGQVNRPRDKLEYILDEFALPLGLIIFGSAGVCIRMFYAMSDLQCIGFLKGTSLSPNVSTHQGTNTTDYNYYLAEGMPRLLYNLVVLTLFCLQMPFLIKLHAVRTRKVKYCLHHVILLTAGANFAIWFRGFYKNATFVSGKELHYGMHPLSKSDTLAEACAKFSSAAYIFSERTFKFVLMPFNMKYMLVCLEVLLHAWLVPVNPTMHLSAVPSDPQEDAIEISARTSGQASAPRDRPRDIRHRHPGTTGTGAADHTLVHSDIITANSSRDDQHTQHADDSLHLLASDEDTGHSRAQQQQADRWYSRWYCHLQLLHSPVHWLTAWHPHASLRRQQSCHGSLH